MNPFVLKKPVITEKSYKLAQGHVYTFEVDPKATKGQIKEAVQDTFGVTVLSVQTSKIHGKVKRTGSKRMVGKLPNRKKAIVRVPDTQVIEVFELNTENTAQ